MVFREKYNCTNDLGPLLTLMPEHLQLLVKDLIVLKSTLAEAFIIKIDPNLLRYIDDEFKNCTEGAKELPKESFGIEMLDTFFRNTIKRYDN